MDGNRRWSRNNHQDLTSSYYAGGDKLCSVVDFFRGLKKTITLSFFAFSKENWKRPQFELDTLFSCVEHYCQSILSRYKPGDVSFEFIGDRSKWPETTKKVLEHLEVTYNKQSHVSVIIAVNYSGQWDIDQAVDKAVKSGSPTAWNRFLQASQHVEPEILIRTGFQQRISNYYLYNLAYTELYFPKVLWPDFHLESLKEILRDYKLVERNFGSSSLKLERESEIV